VASVEVNWKYDLNQLADRIEELSVQVGGEVLGFEVIEQTANRISVRVKVRPKGGSDMLAISRGASAGGQVW